MYWAAFLASGKVGYLDAIIDAALRYARLNAGGRQNEASFPVCAAAAASGDSAPTAARRFLTRFPFAPLLLPSRDLYGGEGVSP